MDRSPAKIEPESPAFDPVELEHDSRITWAIALGFASLVCLIFLAFR